MFSHHPSLCTREVCYKLTNTVSILPTRETITLSSRLVTDPIIRGIYILLVWPGSYHRDDIDTFVFDYKLGAVGFALPTGEF